MAKTIERIWKDGFINSDAMVAPELSDLYERKSLHTVDKFKRMSKLNLIGIAVMALMCLVGSIILGVPFTGVIIFISLLIALGFGYKQLLQMKQLDASLDSYHYLMSLNRFLNKSMVGFIRVYRFVYPAVTLAIIQATWSIGGFNQRIKTDDSQFYIVMGMPLSVFTGAILLAILSALFAGPIYRFDINMFYGRVFKKLDEMLDDMEELRK